jgi:methionine-rich copper-binding protein CopC
MVRFMNKKCWAMVLAVLVLSMLTALPALAGNGDGTGGGKGEPLRLVSSTPADGQKDVSLPVEIKLTFSKNVVHMSVNDNNRNCFSLYTSAGSAVPVEVVMADDQVEPEKKNDVVLKPLQSLQPGTEYVVKISPELQSKSGVTLESQVSVVFTTAAAGAGNTGAAAGAQNSGNEAQGAAEPSPAVVGDTSSASSGKEPGNNEENQGDNKNSPVVNSVTQQDTAPDAPTVKETPIDNKPVVTQNPTEGQDTKANSSYELTPGQSINAGTLLALGLALVIAVVAGGYVYRRQRK